MSDLRVRGLNHASVRISDLARSRAFYEGLLGLTAAPRPDLDAMIGEGLVTLERVRLIAYRHGGGA